MEASMVSGLGDPCGTLHPLFVLLLVVYFSLRGKIKVFLQP